MNENTLLLDIFTQKDTDRIHCSIGKKYFPVVDSNGDIESLGEGGMGSVYSVIRRCDNRKMAMKVTGLRNWLGNQRDIYDLVDKIEMQKKFSEKSLCFLPASETIICRLYGHSGVSDPAIMAVEMNMHDLIADGPIEQRILVFTFMDYAMPVITDNWFTNRVEYNNWMFEGHIPDIRDFITEKHSRYVKGIIYLAYDIASALLLMKKKEIAHRDVKPDNIYYDPETFHFMLGDFDIIRHTGRHYAYTRVGTDGFAAPEIYREMSYDPFLADIYSLGMTLFTMMNRLAFPGEPAGSLHRTSNARVLSASYADKYTKKLTGSSGLGYLVSRMLRHDPEERIASIEKVIRNLLQIADKYGIYDLKDESRLQLREEYYGR